MANNVIPDSNHISRYCKPSAVADEKPLPAAFLLREGDDYLSVDWLEVLKQVSGSCDSAAITEALEKRGLKVKKRGKHAIFNVGKLIEYVKEKSPDSRMLSVHHIPRYRKDSHSGVYSHQEENNLIAVLISQTINEVLNTQ